MNRENRDLAGGDGVNSVDMLQLGPELEDAEIRRELAVDFHEKSTPSPATMAVDIEAAVGGKREEMEWEKSGGRKLLLRRWVAVGLRSGERREGEGAFGLLWIRAWALRLDSGSGSWVLNMGFLFEGFEQWGCKNGVFTATRSEAMGMEFPLGEELEGMRLQRSLEVWKMGVVNYLDALKLQEKLVSDRKSGKILDTLLSLQHPPTFTLGKRRTYHNLLVPEADLQTLGAELHYTQRGGDITFHGPHQAILYPIISLRDIGLGARKYVENLELVMIELASLYSVQACAGRTCETGVWVGDRKIGAIGVRISSSITSHGLAFNIDPDLNYFKHIVPCGIADKGVTSLRRETNKLLPAEEVIQEQLISGFARLFGYSSIVYKENVSILSENEEIK
ncbi:hypothetical protein HHK36_019859 [Tetracentron sinense]|uniref:lipoyl(octanoyl) transferase n=1 Tax=Tetracentron sinense TaxID=13715 RepID=A0A834YUD5_TETSI|nr:hypothetical protein HHK36_019859 [Tetracentron sinense]